MHCKTLVLDVILCVVTDWIAVNWMKEELSVGQLVNGFELLEEVNSTC